MPLNAFAKYAWGFLSYNLLVIIWGAYVRATGSGAGCGRHWPVCQGEVIPRSPGAQTLIEYSHRLSSGLALLGVLLLVIFAFKTYPKGHLVRKASAWSLLLMLTEAGLGAGLVLFELVADDVSMARVFSMPIHLTNTFLLLGAISLTAWWASGGQAPVAQGWSKNVKKIGGAILCLFLIGMSGAVTALGDTLFPVDQMGELLVDNLAAQVLVELRIFHPIFAVLTGFYIIFMAISYERRSLNPTTRKLGRNLILIFLLQLVVGSFNVILKAPVGLQMFHLFIADLVWISLVLLTAQVLSQKE